MPEEDMTRIKKIGLELEGGWTHPPDGLHRDGSIERIPAEYTVGEIASQPIAGLGNAERWLRDKYPTTSNETCGFHVHLSFNELNYSRLMEEDYNQFFLRSMEDFYRDNAGKPGFDLFRRRLDGQNQYRQKVFRPELQLWRDEAYGDRATHPRYSQLNFCYGRHGTLECRLFPLFPNVEDSVLALHAFHSSCELYLRRCQPEKPLTHTVNCKPPRKEVLEFLSTHPISKR